MSFFGSLISGRTLFLALLIVGLAFNPAPAKTLCHSCKGTGVILEVARQCPYSTPDGYLVPHGTSMAKLQGCQCNGNGVAGPPCPYCGGLGYILTAAEKEAEKKARAEADARAQEEAREAQAKRAVEKAREDSVARVERVKRDSSSAERVKGARSPGNIQRTVMMNMAALRYAYNKRLREKPGLAGEIEVKFTINEFGKVLSAQIVKSTMRDSEFESVLVGRVKIMDFEKINVAGDVTTVTYPWVFGQ
jgi:TonB family protein